MSHHGGVETIVLGRAETPDGEVVLRRRGEVDELVVNGVFAMDTVDTSSERVLADAAGSRPGVVLVGGLGLGFTTARLLHNGAAEVDVVERAGPLLEWARAGVTEQLGRVAADPRVRLHHADQREHAQKVLTEALRGEVALDDDPVALTARLAPGQDTAEQGSHALGELARAGILVDDFSLGQPSLDEVFLALTDKVGA